MPVNGLILETPDGAIVPVRAIPYVTGRAFSPRAVAVAIADGRQDADHRLFETQLHAGYIDAACTLKPMAYAELLPYAQEVEQLFQGDATLIDQIAAMPAGVYVPLAEVQSLVNETNQICGGPSGDGLAPITILRHPMVNSPLRALILEGFGALARGRARTIKRAPAARVRPSDGEEDDRSAVQAIALRLWAERRMSISAMLKEQDLARYMRGWSKNTVRAWISAVDSRSALQKPGRRWPKARKR